MSGKAVLFDYGNVLIEWDPRRLYRTMFADEAALEHFLRDICPMSWHMRHDSGEAMAVTIPERIALFPEARDAILAWRDRFAEMLGPEIADNVALIPALKAKGHKIGILTNMPAEVAWTCFAPFTQWANVDTILVSGFVKAAKPGRRAFDLASAQLGVSPENTFFLDDSLPNIEAAAALGYLTHHVRDRIGPRAALQSAGFLD